MSYQYHESWLLSLSLYAQQLDFFFFCITTSALTTILKHMTIHFLYITARTSRYKERILLWVYLQKVNKIFWMLLSNNTTKRAENRAIPKSNMKARATWANRWNGWQNMRKRSTIRELQKSLCNLFSLLWRIRKLYDIARLSSMTKFIWTIQLWRFHTSTNCKDDRFIIHKILNSFKQAKLPSLFSLRCFGLHPHYVLFTMSFYYRISQCRITYKV